MAKKHSFKVGDVVTCPPRNSAQHRSRAVIVKITKKKITVLHMPDHPKNSTVTYKPDQLRYWRKGNRNKRMHG